MFDRETKKEKNLDTIKKAAEQKSKAQKENKAYAAWEEKKATVIKQTEEEFFAKMGKYSNTMLEDAEKDDDEEKPRFGGQDNIDYSQDKKPEIPNEESKSDQKPSADQPQGDLPREDQPNVEDAKPTENNLADTNPEDTKPPEPQNN